MEASPSVESVESPQEELNATIDSNDDTKLLEFSSMRSEIDLDESIVSPSVSQSSTSMGTTGCSDPKRQQPNPVDFLKPTPKDHLDLFFESICSTMRTLPALSIAKLKMKISQLVYAEEFALAEAEAYVPLINSNASPISTATETAVEDPIALIKNESNTF